MGLMKAEQFGVPLVLFSGGLDSTYVLLSTLRKYEKVDVLICELTGLDHINTRADRAASEILEKVEALSKSKPSKYGVVRFIERTQSSGHSHGASLITQPIGWLTAAFYRLKKDTSEVLYGAVKGDDTVLLYSAIINLWQSMMGVTYTECFGDNPPNLNFPIVHDRKEDLVWDKDWYPIMKKVTWCENLKSVSNDCGFCPSCKTMTRSFGIVKLINPGTEWKKHPLSARIDKLIDKQLKGDK